MRNTLAPRFGRRCVSPACRTPTICVVDPQAEDYQGWDSLARTNGAQLKIFATAEEALRYSRDHDADLWVVNATLPGLSGFELTSMLKARSAHTAVYLVADHYTPAIECLAWQSRATFFGCKPAHGEWLRQWLDRRSSQLAPASTATLRSSI